MNQHHLKISILVGRLALFTVYFWFGALKLFNLSPANPMVAELLKRTLPFMTFGDFILIFACFEMVIGILFLIPKMEKWALGLFTAHMIMTSLPLSLMPEMTWQAFLTPTLEGQYIIKNIVLAALALFIYTSTEHISGDAPAATSKIPQPPEKKRILV